MKIHSLLALVSLLPLAGFGATSPEKFLLKAESIRVESNQRMVATGRATAIAPEFRIVADEIISDPQAHTLTCSGDITLHVGETVMRVKSLIVDVTGTRLFWLSNGTILPAPGDATLQQKVGPADTLEFTVPFPKTETGLKRAAGDR